MKAKIIFLVFILLFVFSGCKLWRDTSLPDKLIGVWKTSEPRYSERFFELRKGIIVFGTGGDSISTYPITDVNKVVEKGKTLFTIYYANKAGQEYQLSFYYEEANGGLIRFKNQKQIVWKKEEFSDSPS